MYLSCNLAATAQIKQISSWTETTKVNLMGKKEKSSVASHGKPETAGAKQSGGGKPSSGGKPTGGAQGKGGKDYAQKLKLNQIVVQSMKQADDIVKQLSKGGSFEELAKKFSIDSASKAAGGALGSVEKKDVPIEIWDASLRLRVNEVSDPIKAAKGVYIIKRTV